MFFAQLLARIQLEFVHSGILSDKGIPVDPKNYAEDAKDGVAIYNYVKQKLVDNRVSYETALKYVDEGNAMVKKLVNDEQIVNKYLLSLMLLRLYLDEEGSKAEQIMIKPKVERSLKLFGLDDEEKKLRKTTHRVADNLWRQFIGRPQLGDDLRDNRFKRIIK